MTSQRTVGAVLALAMALAAFVWLAGCSREEPSNIQPPPTPRVLQPAGRTPQVSASPRTPGKLYKETEILMGTTVMVSLYPPQGRSGRELAARAFDAMNEIDRLMSDYRPDSEVSLINRQAGGDYVPVSAKVHDMILRAGYFSRLSGGAFDPTIRPLLRLWQAAGKAKQLPDPGALEQARSLVNWLLISPMAWTDREPAFAVRLGRKGMELDLGGIAKGYAVDRAIAALKEQGVRRALVDAGGDLFALGAHPDGRPWVIGIQSPNNEGALLEKRLRVTDAGVATSGDYRRFVEIEGRRYSHIIDPRTGQPVEHMASVTVIAPNATDADALATTLSVLGPKAGMALARRLPHVEAMMLVREPTGQIGTVQSGGFLAFVSD